MPTAALYARVSTKDKNQDPENQLIPLRRWATQHGYDVVEYVDKVSGTGKVRRLKFEQMMTDAKQGKISVVAVWALDRFGREGVENTFRYLRKLKEWGVKFHSYGEPMLSTLGGGKNGEFQSEMMASMLAIFAKQESVRRSDRALAAYDRLRESGTWDHIGRKRKVWPRGKAVEMRREGKSIREIRKALAKMGYKVSTMSVHGAVKNVIAGAPASS